MGLDMYLSANRHVSGFSFQDEEEKKRYAALVKEWDIEGAASLSSPFASVQFTVAYWRKANQIHAWFVKNVQDGEDECNPHSVSRKQLSELRALCQKVLDHPDTAEETLPTQSGFFFGSTEYGEYYREGLRSTIKQLDRVLALPEDWDFEYRSSW